MSAESKGSTTAGEKTTFFFGQDVPIPTYLLALVVGKLEGRYEKQAMTI
jgi:aminopeptidase N